MMLMRMLGDPNAPSTMSRMRFQTCVMRPASTILLGFRAKTMFEMPSDR